MTIQGLHHITLICRDAERTVDFYTQILGLRLVKLTVNFDDPHSYHLYFGEARGRPGSVVTFFQWPDAARGRPGMGGTHHFALTVADDTGLLMWKRWLHDRDISVDGPFDRHYFRSIYFRDPDGAILEIATRGPGFLIDEDEKRLGTAHRPPPSGMVLGGRDEAAIASEIWPEPVPQIATEMALSHGLHHISAIGSDIERTDAFYQGLLGLQRVKMTGNFDDPGSAHWYWGVDNGQPGTLVTYFQRDPQRTGRAEFGAGQTHHFALSVPDEESQLSYQEKLRRAGLAVSEVKDRVYFKSIYTRDPDGHIVEIATAGPGFLVDEDEAHLGQRLQLPPWLQGRREEIEAALPSLEMAGQR